MSKVIGIDLGTTNSCMAYYDHGQAIIIPNDQGQKTTPSIVAYTKEGERLVGETARRQMSLNPQNTVVSIKREMGTKHKTKMNGRSYMPQEISAMILQKLKIDAAAYLQDDVTQAVITVPAYFNDDQRQATKDAGRIAGLDVLRIINEPTAAALAYGLDNAYGQKVMVFDLGGGTFDVSIIEIGQGVIEVLATSGDNHLGGDDFDQVLSDYMLENFEKTSKIKIRRDVTALSRIKEAAQQAKKELSTLQTTHVMLPFIAQTRQGPVNLDMTISRETFNDLIRPIVAQTKAPLMQAMQDAMLTERDIDKIIMVGGSTRVPYVVSYVEGLLHQKVSHVLNPDECVAMGAAIQASKLGGELIVSGQKSAHDVLLLDVTPLTLSVETFGGVATPLISRNTTIPVSYSQIFTTSANFQTQVEINVLQGERPLARDNRSLGKFWLKGIKRALRGVPQIEVTFDIDANGIVHVTARDLATGNAQSITIESQVHMSDADIERAIHEARMYEEADLRRKDRLIFKNEAELVVTTIENNLAARSHELDKNYRKQVKDALKSYQAVASRIDVETCDDRQFDDLRNALDRLKNDASLLL